MYSFSFISLCATKKVLTTGREIPVKLSTYAFAELGAKHEVIGILKRHHYSKSSLHLTRFILIINHITCSIFSLEGDALVPLDTVILFELESVPFRAPGRGLKHKEERTLLFRERTAQKMLSLCEKIYLKQDRNPKCPTKGYQVTGRIANVGERPFTYQGMSWCLLPPVLEIVDPAFKYINCCCTLTAVQIND